MNLPSDHKFHLAFQDDDQFVSCMREILSAPSKRVDPEVATEPPLCPIGCNLFLVDFGHRQISPHGSQYLDTVLSHIEAGAFVRGRVVPSMPPPRLGAQR